MTLTLEDNPDAIALLAQELSPMTASGRAAEWQRLAHIYEQELLKAGHSRDYCADKLGWLRKELTEELIRLDRASQPIEAEEVSSDRNQ